MKLLIIGCGRLGARLAQTLALRGHDLTVVDRDPEALARLGPSFKGHRHVGHGLGREVLQAAGIERMDGVAAVTGSDETNVVVARAARRVFRVPRIVARVYDPAKAEIYRQLGVVTISPIAWGVNRLIDSLTFPELEVIASLGSGDVELVQVEVGARLAGRTVRDVNLAGQVQVVSLRRKAHYQLPSVDTPLAARDQLCVAVVPAAMERVKALLGLV
jgi:trk system potassium uptake protein TrkA